MTLRLATLATAAFVAAPPAVPTGGPGLVLGATEDAVQLELAGRGEGADGLARARRLPRRAHHADLGARTARGVRRRRDGPPQRCGGRAARRRHGRDDRDERRQQDDAALRPGSARLRRVRGVGCRGVAGAADPDHRQRAEPQPVLAAAVRRRRQRRCRARLRGLLARATTPSRRHRPASPCSAAQCHRAAATSQAGSGRRTPRPCSSTTSGQAYRASGRTTPIMDGFAFHPYEDNSSVAPLERAASQLDHDRARRLREARRVARRGVRRHRAAGLDAADLVRRVRRRDADPADEAGALHGHRAGDDEAGRPRRRRPRTTARRSQLAFCQPNVRGLFLFHTVDETDLARMAVRRLLRGRHAEVEPRRGQGGARRGAARRRRAVPRMELTRASEGRAAKLGPDASRATSTASTSPSSYRLPGKLLVVEVRDARSAACRRRSRYARRRRTGSYRLRLSADRVAERGTAARCCAFPCGGASDSGRGRPVRRIHLLPRRPGVAAAPGRGAAGRQGRVRRGRRGLRRPLRRTCARTRRRAFGRTPTSSSGRSPSATRTSASSAPR